MTDAYYSTWLKLFIHELEYRPEFIAKAIKCEPKVMAILMKLPWAWCITGGFAVHLLDLTKTYTDIDILLGISNYSMYEEVKNYFQSEEWKFHRSPNDPYNLKRFEIQSFYYYKTKIDIIFVPMRDIRPYFADDLTISEPPTKTNCIARFLHYIDTFDFDICKHILFPTGYIISLNCHRNSIANPYSLVSNARREKYKARLIHYGHPPTLKTLAGIAVFRAIRNVVN